MLYLKKKKNVFVALDIERNLLNNKIIVKCKII